MTNHDLNIGQQRGKMRDVSLIVADRRFQRRLDLARIRGATVAAKWPRNKAFI
jgi:hypothetical protein